ncbi:MAG: MFS transporter [Oscillospiraceae bacterium]|nr:MFS transporter [Oscillospiraceae bacterium]
MNTYKSEKPDAGGEPKKERLLTKDYTVVMLSSGCINFFNNACIAAMPLYMMFLTGRAFFSGLIMSAYSLTALAVRPAAGVLCDKFGRVRLLVAGAFLCALSCAGFGFTTAIAFIIALRLTGGVGFGFQSTCAGAVAADVVPKSRLAEGIGYYSLNSTVGQILAPAIALFIIAGGTIEDYKNLFFICAGITFAAGIFGSLITYERKQKMQKDVRAGLYDENPDEKTDLISDPFLEPPPSKTVLGFEYGVFAPAAVMILLYFGFSSVFTFLTVFADWKGFGNSGLFYTFSAVGVLASRLVVGKIVDKRGSDIIVIPFLALLTVCMSILPLVRSMAQLSVLAVPIGLAQGAILPAMNSMMFRRCSPARRGTASGAFFASIDLGFAVSTPILGVISDATDIRFAFWVSAVWIAVSLLVYILICTDKRYYEKKARR